MARKSAGRKPVTVIPLSRFWAMLSVGTSKAKRLLDDPEFPRDGLVEIGLNRLGIREDRAADFQHILEQRAQRARPITSPTGLVQIDPRAAGIASGEARRKKAAERRAALSEST